MQRIGVKLAADRILSGIDNSPRITPWPTGSRIDPTPRLRYDTPF